MGPPNFHEAVARLISGRNGTWSTARLFSARLSLIGVAQSPAWLTVSVGGW
jgi:hypothetical protein